MRWWTPELSPDHGRWICRKALPSWALEQVRCFWTGPEHLCSPLLPPHLHHWCQLHLLLCLALDLGLTKPFLYIVFIFSHCQGALSELDLPVPKLEQSNSPRAQSKFLFSSNWCRGCRSHAFPLKHTWSCAQWLNTKLHSPSDCRALFLPG